MSDAQGRRHSVDVLAASTFDAAHLYVMHAKTQPGTGIPPITLATVFEVIIDGKVHMVAGKALQSWIVKEARGAQGAARAVVFAATDA